VSFSGGKDSTAMLLKMIEEGYEIDEVIFGDSLLELPDMYRHIDHVDSYLQETIGLTITRLKPPLTYDEHFYGKLKKGKLKGGRRGLPYGGYPCRWSGISKGENVQRYLKEIHSDYKQYLGIATNEKNRARLRDPIFEYPLIDWGWSEEDCRAYLKDERPEFYPLILQRFDRTGCYLCPKQSRESLGVLYEFYPEYWEKLKSYAHDSPHSFTRNKTIDDIEEEIKHNIWRRKTLDILNS